MSSTLWSAKTSPLANLTEISITNHAHVFKPSTVSSLSLGLCCVDSFNSRLCSTRWLENKHEPEHSHRYLPHYFRAYKSRQLCPTLPREQRAFYHRSKTRLYRRRLLPGWLGLYVQTCCRHEKRYYHHNSKRHADQRQTLPQQQTIQT